MPQTLSQTTCAFGTVTPLVAHRVLHARFIHINPTFFGHAFQRFYELGAFSFITLDVKPALFLRVHPKRRTQLENVRSLKL